MSKAEYTHEYTCGCIVSIEGRNIKIKDCGDATHIWNLDELK